MSYTAAYNYLVQCAFPEVYKNSDGTWKTKDEVNGKLELKTDADGNAILDSDGNKQYITKVLKKDEVRLKTIRETKSMKKVEHLIIW